MKKFIFLKDILKKLFIIIIIIRFKDTLELLKL